MNFRAVTVFLGTALIWFALGSALEKDLHACARSREELGQVNQRVLRKLSKVPFSRADLLFTQMNCNHLYEFQERRIHDEGWSDDLKDMLEEEINKRCKKIENTGAVFSHIDLSSEISGWRDPRGVIWLPAVEFDGKSYSAEFGQAIEICRRRGAELPVPRDIAELVRYFGYALSPNVRENFYYEVPTWFPGNFGSFWVAGGMAERSTGTIFYVNSAFLHRSEYHETSYVVCVVK